MRMRILLTGLRVIFVILVCVRGAQSQGPRLASGGPVVLRRRKWLSFERSAFGASPAEDTVATNHSVVIIDPISAVETCDSSFKGYYIAEMDLLDWEPTVAPKFMSVLTGYEPPASSTGRLGGIAAGGANEGRLRSDLRAAAMDALPDRSLCLAATAFALGKAYDGNAFADLSVTGRLTFARFRAQPPRVADILPCVRQQLSATGIADAQVQTAVGRALDRAYSVIRILRAGGWRIACPERDLLSPRYFAVSGEDDLPHRPVNVPSAEFPQYDLDVSVPRKSMLPITPPPLSVHTRYMIAHTMPPQGAEAASCAPMGRTVPADRVPVLATDAEVILYIHGMDSRLEEALSFTHQIQAIGLKRHKNYTVVSMDLPTSGYADNIDHTTIAPLTDDGAAGGGIGFALGFSVNGYLVPILDFDENFIVSFVNKLDEKLGSNHPLTNRLVAIVGGSLGGNLSMRLGRPRSDALWITNIVSWSPASIWPSKADPISLDGKIGRASCRERV